MTNYTGIKIITAATNQSYIRIENGIHNVVTVAENNADLSSAAQGGDPAFVLTSVTIDATNNVFSGYDTNGVRYIFDKAANITAQLA
tara:strand:- start:1162 stop:1422 length:261 start_codon:yes stop_codon:yes gene_type:complete